MKKKKLKKIWVVSLTLMSLLLVIAGSVAIYTSQVYQRAVVRNRYNDVIRFSSDDNVFVVPLHETLYSNPAVPSVIAKLM